MNIRLDGKTALVTGAGQGIGRAIAEAMHEAGAQVMAADIDEASVEAVASACGTGMLSLRLDVSHVQDCRGAVETAVEQMGCLDILVNNAGICPQRPIMDVDQELFDHMVAVNMRGPYFMSQAAAEHMKTRQTGRIINISSVGGKTGGAAEISVYAATKAALFAITKSFANYLAPHGTVNTIAPGPTVTRLTSNWQDPELMERLRQSVPLRRLGEPADYAAMAVFLASDKASFMTGSTVDINGGIRMD